MDTQVFSKFSSESEFEMVVWMVLGGEGGRNHLTGQLSRSSWSSLFGFQGGRVKIAVYLVLRAI